MTNKRILTFIFVLLLNLSFSQTQISKQFDPKIVIDTTAIELQDYNNALLYDAQWRAEFFDDSLYDSISKAVNENTSEAVNFAALSLDTLQSRLQQLDAKTPFHIHYNPALETLIKKYLKQRKVLYERLMKLSQYYFPLFEDIFDREGIPLEIKYLAIVESALRPNAKSRVGATGLWQFMFSTGKYYDLEVSSYVDERCDPVRSTIAAAKYLKSLYKVFNDWDLALAAYNSGPGNVTKAIRRSGGYQNYWNIRPFLPRETAGYLPAFLATMYLFEYAPQHGFNVSKHQMPIIKTDTIQIKRMISLKQVSAVIDIDLETLEFLNPSYKLGIIPYIKNKNYALRLPLEMVGTFVSNEDQIYAYAKAEFDRREKPLPKFFKLDTKIRYKVQPGDYLGKIAKKFRVRISQIKQWNGLRSDQLKAGSRLTIFTRNPQQ
ncbi:transglycosylase SLT domain-containing protein [Flavobacteriaceae bacterium]|nr:transglycosylase SLT domain-containing protein [Flavobacteriaceae bacterium]MDB2631600.1 transglycosylase SLT domain-containing protein [Flavobacteriaceae bacterium]